MNEIAERISPGYEFFYSKATNSHIISKLRFADINLQDITS